MKLLKDLELCLTKNDALKNIAVPFQVRQSFAKLVIQMHYAPHSIEDRALCASEIQKCIRRYRPDEEKPIEQIHPEDYATIFNFVTLSLDCGTEYVGCAHRHDPAMHIVISEKASSPGFFPAPIREGAWRVMLHVHAVISEEIPCRLRIWGVEEADHEYQIPAF